MRDRGSRQTGFSCPTVSDDFTQEFYFSHQTAFAIDFPIKSTEDENRFENTGYKQLSSVGIIYRSLINVKYASIENVLDLKINKEFFFFFSTKLIIVITLILHIKV